MKLEEIPIFIVKTGMKQGATDVVAELAQQNHVMIRFSNNEITVSKTFKETSIGIYLMVEKHRAAMTLPVKTPSKLEKTVNNLVKIAKLTPPADIYAPLPKGPFQYDPLLLKAPEITLDPDELTEYVNEAIEGAREKGAQKVAGTLNATRTIINLATSGNVEVTQEKTMFEISVRAFTSDVASGHSVSIARNEKNLQPVETGRTAGEIAKAAANPTQGQPGKYLTLLGPMVFADFINQVGALSSAFLVDAGQSFLAERIGKEVASKELTLVDDPTIDDAPGGNAYDDEGIPTRRNAIIEKGTLKTYLHNSTTAKKYNTETTGNAGLIEPHPWSLIVEQGNKSFEDLKAQVDRGIYVTNDWYLRYQNYRTGDFSTIPRDGMFLIEKGEITSPIRELRISDNMIRIMQNIEALSHTRKWIKWWEVETPTLTPYALIKDLNFSKSSM